MDLSKIKTPLPQPALDVMARVPTAVEFLLHQAKARNTEIWPAFLIPNFEGQKVALCPMKMPDQDEKGQLASICEFIADREGAAAFVSEAWAAEIKVQPDSALVKTIKEDPDSLVIIPPRIQPNRKDVVMVQLFIRGGRRLGFMAEIKGTGAGRIVAPLEHHFDSADSERPFTPISIE